MISDIDRAFAAGVRARREALRMTQRALATKIGTDHTTISRMENGRTGSTLATAAAIADALGVPIDVLLGRSPTPDEARIADLADLKRAARELDPHLQRWLEFWRGVDGDDGQA